MKNVFRDREEESKEGRSKYFYERSVRNTNEHARSVISQDK